MKIKSGDTLSQIAKSQGMTLKALLAANPQTKNANQIRVGQTITIPPKAMQAGSASKNPYAGMTRTQMNMMDVKNKDTNKQEAVTRGMQTQGKYGGSKNSPTKSKTEETLRKAPHIESPSQLRERAKKYAASRKNRR